MRKQKILTLYRSLIKSAIKIEDKELRQSIRVQIRNAFNENRLLSDTVAIKSCLTEAKRSLAQIEALSVKSDSSEHVVVGTNWPWSRR